MPGSRDGAKYGHAHYRGRIFPLSTLRKKQHYVWAHHLRAWETEGKLWAHWRSRDQILETNTGSVANKTFFYRKQELSEGDLRVIKVLIARATSQETQRLNRGWVDTHQMSFHLRRLIGAADVDPVVSSKLLAELDAHDKSAVEGFYTSIEQAFQPGLDALRRGETDFYASPEMRRAFITFISFQYFRTAGMKDRVVSSLAGSGLKVPDYDPERTWLVEAQIFSTNLGASLTRERARYGLAMLENSTSAPFITGDQPVINRLSSEDEDVLLYFPVSPHRAILFGPLDQIGAAKRGIGVLEAETLNQLIFAAAGDQTYAHDGEYLTALARIGHLDL